METAPDDLAPAAELGRAEQALELLDRIDRPGTVFGHLETFHMNLEEPDVTAAVRLLGDRLGSVHVAESHRGVIGRGWFPFERFFAALLDMEYSGPAIVEAFVNAPADLRIPTASWHPVAGDTATVVDDRLEHIRDLLESVGLLA